MSEERVDKDIYSNAATEAEAIRRLDSSAARDAANLRDLEGGSVRVAADGSKEKAALAAQAEPVPIESGNFVDDMRHVLLKQRRGPIPKRRATAASVHDKSAVGRSVVSDSSDAGAVPPVVSGAAAAAASGGSAASVAHSIVPLPEFSAGKVGTSNELSPNKRDCSPRMQEVTNIVEQRAQNRNAALNTDESNEDCLPVRTGGSVDSAGEGNSGRAASDVSVDSGRVEPLAVVPIVDRSFSVNNAGDDGHGDRGSSGAVHGMLQSSPRLPPVSAEKGARKRPQAGKRPFRKRNRRFSNDSNNSELGSFSDGGGGGGGRNGVDDANGNNVNKNNRNKSGRGGGNDAARGSGNFRANESPDLVSEDLDAGSLAHGDENSAGSQGNAYQENDYVCRDHESESRNVGDENNENDERNYFSDGGSIGAVRRRRRPAPDASRSSNNRRVSRVGWRQRQRWEKSNQRTALASDGDSSGSREHRDDESSQSDLGPLPRQLPPRKRKRYVASSSERIGLESDDGESLRAGAEEGVGGPTDDAGISAHLSPERRGRERLRQREIRRLRETGRSSSRFKDLDLCDDDDEDDEEDDDEEDEDDDDEDGDGDGTDNAGRCSIDRGRGMERANVFSKNTRGDFSKGSKRGRRRGGRVSGVSPGRKTASSLPLAVGGGGGGGNGGDDEGGDGGGGGAGESGVRERSHLDFDDLYNRRVALQADIDRLTLAEKRQRFRSGLVDPNAPVYELVGPCDPERTYGSAAFNVPVPLHADISDTYEDSKNFVVRELGWPAIQRTDTLEESLFVVCWIENACAIENASGIHGLAAGGDRSGSGPSMDARPVGRYRDFTMRYTREQMHRSPLPKLIYDFVGLNYNTPLGDLRERGEVINVNAVEKIFEGMHAYLELLQRNLSTHIRIMPYQLNDAARMAQEEVICEASRICESPEAAEERRRNIRLQSNIVSRIRHLHSYVKNVRVNLRSSNLVGSSGVRRAGLPIDLTGIGMMDANRDPNAGPRGAKAGGKERQHTLMRLLHECYNHCYRRHGDYLYREIRSGAHATQAFEPYMTIKQFVWRMPNPVMCTDEWMRVTEDKSAQKWMEDYLMNANHELGEMLPDLKRVRTQWSFTNGIYTAHNNRFWEYNRAYPDDNDNPFNSGSASARFFKLPFDPQWTSIPACDIPVEPVECIFESQKWTPDVRIWAWVMIGRLLYDVGTYDNWQVVPYLFGMAGTGKSTLIEALQNIYDPSDVGTFNNRMEGTFGLQGLHDKFLVVGPEIRADFSLDQAHFQSMASGERMSVPRKNLMALEIERWKAPSIYSGNVFPKWLDSRGSLTRRMFALLFEYPVLESESRPNLREDILRALPALIVKANRHYILASVNYRNHNIWNVLPAVFKENRQALRQQLDNVANFLDECEISSRDPDHYVTIKQFEQALRLHFASARLDKGSLPKTTDLVHQLKSNFTEGKSLVKMEEVEREPGSSRKEWRIYNLYLPRETAPVPLVAPPALAALVSER